MPNGTCWFWWFTYSKNSGEGRAGALERIFGLGIYAMRKLSSIVMFCSDITQDTPMHYFINLLMGIILHILISTKYRTGAPTPETVPPPNQ
jgi:hypothetical protein